MDKSSHSESNSNSNKDQFLKQLNKLSHKITKPTIKKPSFESHQNQNQNKNNFHHQQPHPSQPPVYNINKNDFREVVQKLTGSPAHEMSSILAQGQRQAQSLPPPIQAPRPPSSRLQRIRPPPLSQITNRPPPPPMSPLPPLPPVHAAAESPVSAYMRYLKGVIECSPKDFSGFSPLAPLVSPRWNGTSQQQQGIQAPLQLPPSTLPFGCLNSPLLSPSLLFTPSSTAGFSQLPNSPTMPVPSPKWR